MPSTAFNPRGTSGSGKTTIARYILQISNAQPVELSGNRVLVYRGKFEETPLYVIGSYGTACGGCDTISRVATVAELVTNLMDDALPKIVVYEGLMISHMIGTVGSAVRKYGSRHIMGFLDTPLQTCLDRVQTRRTARGASKPFNPDNTVRDHANVLRCKNNAIRDGFTVRTIDHLNAVPQSIGILHELSQVAKSVRMDTGEGEYTRQEAYGSQQALDY
jgi:hypothetical protein